MRIVLVPVIFASTAHFTLPLHHLCHGLQCNQGVDNFIAVFGWWKVQVMDV
jgi:hypothetical protein